MSIDFTISPTLTIDLRHSENILCGQINFILHGYLQANPLKSVSRKMSVYIDCN